MNWRLLKKRINYRFSECWWLRSPRIDLHTAVSSVDDFGGVLRGVGVIRNFGILSAFEL